MRSKAAAARAEARGPRSARRSALSALGLALAALALAAAAFLATPSRSGPSLAGSRTSWKGYRLLLVDSRADEQATLARLKEAGAWPAISASTQPVLVSDWSRPVETTLAEALESLIPGDPRLDSYIRRLGSWFEARVGGEPYRVIYLPESRSRGQAVSKALEGLGIEYALPEAAAASPLDAHPRASFAVSAAIMALAIAASSLMGRSPHSLQGSALRLRPPSRALETAAARAAIAAPFAAIAWKGGWASACAALWALAILDLADTADAFARELSLGAGMRRAFGAAIAASPPGLAVLAAALGAAAAQASLAPAIAAGLGSSAAATALASRLGLPGRRRFSPISIGGKRSRPGPASASRAILACAAVAAAAAASLAGGPIPARAGIDADAAYPSPIALPGGARPLPAEAAARLGEEAIDGRLPGLASWLAHSAFQEAIPYARLGEDRPDPFASLALPSIEGAGPRVDFGDDWARAAYRGLDGPSVELMLASQDGATIGALGPTAAGGPRNGPPLAPMSALLYILLVIPPLFRIAAVIPSFRASSSRGVRQEA